MFASLTLGLMDENSSPILQYEQLFKRYYAELVRHAFALLQDLDDSKDVVQETFLSVIKNDILHKDFNNLEGYLHQAVHNNSLYWLRKEKKIEQSMQELLLNLDDDSSTEYHDEESFEKIKKILASLPAQQQKAVSVIYFEKMKYQEAADHLGISINTLKTNLRLALHHIRKKVKIISILFHPFLFLIHHIVKAFHI